MPSYFRRFEFIIEEAVIIICFYWNFMNYINKRNQNVEALRVVAMLSILLLHVSGRIFMSENNTVHTIELAVRSYFFIGVSTFAFISGYYGVKWNTSKFLKYESMAIMWGGVIFILNFLVSNHLQMKSLLLLIPILSEVCWYYSAYILLMIISPYINEGINSISLEKYKLLLVLMMVICYGGNFIFHRNGTTFNILLFIYFLARYIKITNFEMSSKKALLLFIASTTLTALSVVFANNFLGGKLLKIICNNYNPFILISALSLFFAFKNMNKVSVFCMLLSKIAPYTFAVYIIHAELLYLNLIPFDSLVFLNQFVCTITISIIIFIICAFAELLRVKFIGKIEDKKIQNFIDRYKL